MTLTSKTDLSDAYKVEIENQKIDELCNGALAHLKKLDTLMIKNSNLKSIAPGSFEGSDELRVLDLTDNEIKQLPAGVFNNLNIRRVNLTNNQISDVDSSAFDNMPKLQTVELSDNRITKFDPAWFSNSPLVYRIVLDRNQVKSLPKDALKHLAESSTRKQKIQLWLSENQINDVHPLAFRNIDEIEALWLDQNKIVALSDTTLQGVKLGRLSLNENMLTCISDIFLSNLSVKDLMLDMNPMDCDCLRKIRKWAASNSVDMTAIRRGLECARESINKAFKAQKQYYEDKLEIERRF